MDLKECLLQYADIKTEIDHLEEKIKKLEAKDENTDIVQSSMKVKPFKLTNAKIITDNKKYINYLRTILQNRYSRLLEQQIKVEEFIDNIPNSRLRRIFTYKYIDNYSYIKIAEIMNKDRKDNFVTADSIRKEHNRYLEKK